jgi:uncharacterized protein YneF (UPF0154 family)
MMIIIAIIVVIILVLMCIGLYITCQDTKETDVHFSRIEKQIE